MRRRPVDASLEGVAKALDRALRDVVILERAASKLTERITPSEERSRPADEVAHVKVPPTLAGIAACLSEWGFRLEWALLDVQRATARIEQISNAAWSRDDIRRWVKPDSRTR